MTRYLIILFSIFLFLSLSSPSAVIFSQEIGIFGNIYKIAEKDPVEEIQKIIDNKSEEIKKKLVKIRKEILISEEEKIYHLPPVKTEKVVVLDTTYVFPEDVVIYDKNGNPYVYKKGTEFDPLKLFGSFPTYIVFNPKRKKELNFVEKYIAGHEYEDIRLLITELPDKELPFAKRVMILTREVANLFKLEGTVAVIQKRKVKIGKKKEDRLVVIYKKF